MRVYLGLGANLGDRAGNLARAVALLEATTGVKVVARSSVFESAPVGPSQPDFLNAAVAVETALSPRQLLGACKAIERELGRLPGGQRWGPRPVDLDLLLAEVTVDELDLQIPHPELHRRAFALAPLCQLLPGGVHPLLGTPLARLLEAVADQPLRPVGPLPEAIRPGKD